MTQVERLIRNLCEEQRLAIVEREREALRILPTQVPWTQLPRRVQEAIRQYRKLEKQQKGMQELVRRAGYESYNMYAGKPLSLLNHRQRQDTVKATYEARRQKIQKRRTDATVASLGKSAVESQAILKQLQKDLAAV